MSNEIAQLVSSIHHQRLSSYLDVCASALFLYDWIVHLSLEVQYMWTAPSSFSTLQILYFVQRYLPFLDTVVLHNYFNHQVFNTTNPHSCQVIISISGWMSITGIVISEITLGFRLWAVWRGKRSFLYMLVIFFVACWIPAYVYFGLFISGLGFGSPPPGLNDNKGCFLIRGNSLLVVSWSMMMLYDTGTFVMMMIPGFKAYRTGGRSELMKVIYRDGAIFFAMIFLVSVANVVVILLLPDELIHLLSAFERVFHSIITSHVILLIRMAGSTKVPQLGRVTLDLTNNTVGSKTDEGALDALEVRVLSNHSEDDLRIPCKFSRGIPY
ncbi:hypothetical protein PM082_014989 [Marasmius tenuissimus]|nr:hypothetical protein PM082_014989 [Marasmius tenuissimus]